MPVDTQPRLPRLCVRWLIISRDMPRVLEIERQSFPHPWSEEEMIRALRQSAVIGLVADDRDQGVVGFMVYEQVDPRRRIPKYLRDLPPSQPRFDVLNLAVDREHRRRGVGKALLDKLKSKLGPRRWGISLHVGENNLDAQLFFRSQGFRASTVIRDFYDQSDEDAYLMKFRPASARLGVNRIAGLDQGGACQGV